MYSIERSLYFTYINLCTRTCVKNKTNKKLKKKLEKYKEIKSEFPF